MKWPTILDAVALLVVAVVVSGCGTATVRVRGLAPLNVNDTGESTPVDVRLFALGSDTTFRGAPFESLWTDPAAALGADLIGKPVQTAVYPGSPGDSPLDIDIDTGGGSWVGIMALYRRSDGMPRTMAVRVEDASDRVLELTGYGLRWEGAGSDGTVDASPPAAVPNAPAPAAASPKSGR